MSPRPGPEGHRSLPHTADAQVEAWATTREGCLREAVAGSVEMVFDIEDAHPSGSYGFHVEADGDDERLLIAVLEEIVYLLDTTGTVPVQTTVRSDAGGCDVIFSTVAVSAIRQIGAVPKAVSLHDLRFARDREGWCCLVTWDV